MKLHDLFLLPALLVGCAHSPRSSSHLFPDPVTVMGHRGARAVAPENTAAGFEVCANLSVPFELDTTLCGSGELVVIHDDTLERTTTGSGVVSETPLAMLSGLDAGAFFSADFSGEPIPTLDRALDFADRVIVNIEVKAGPGTEAEPLAAAVVSLIESRGLVDRVIVTSFNPFVLEQVRLKNPDIYRGQIYGTFRGSDLGLLSRILLKNLAFNRKAVPDLLMVESAMVSRRYTRKMHRRGYRIFTWTVNEPDEIRRVVEAGVDGIITDDPAAALTIIGE
ncbi:MAG: glycerophosphoryl diester phosphodiesterase [Myxococcota bacterium]|jgi:glycerophosphoryl diester phosphodiesterase